MAEVTIHKAKTNLSRLVARAQAGEEITLCRGHVPVALLVPYREKRALRPKVGEITSARVKMKQGCFEPMTDQELAEWGLK